MSRDPRPGSKTTPAAQDSSVAAGSSPPREDARAAPAGSSPPREDARAAPSTGLVAPDQARPFRSVGFTISTTGYAIARRFRELLAPLGLEPREFALLRTVATSEGVTQQSIGERMGVAPSRMVAFVDSLEQRGLLQRRQNPEDRRARALFLTPEGRELLGRAFAVATQHEQQLCSELNAQEREQLLDLLGRVGIQLGIPRGVQVEMGHSAMADE